MRAESAAAARLSPGTVTVTGTVGVTAVLLADASPVPAELTARTSKVYAVPFVRFGTTSEFTAPTAWVCSAVVPVPA